MGNKDNQGRRETTRGRGETAKRDFQQAAGSWQGKDILYEESLLHAASCQLLAGF
jgi:hypothetical protein